MPRVWKVLATQCYEKVIIFMLTIVASAASNCSSNPCLYGICVDDSSSSYRCYCIDGYTGINCETNWNDCWSNPCLNGATCNDAIASYNCTCLEGFVGMTCEQKYSECMNYPCQNNGTCLDHNGFTCQCLEGFSGDFCEIDATVCNNTICKNFGECVEGTGLSFTCRCQSGWLGTFCEEDINECNISPCQNGGLCINMPGAYACACLFGFTGKDCDKNIIPCEANPCQNNAVCLLEDGQPVCYCVPDYHGTFCELRYDDCESQSVYCHNGGTCIDGINNFTCSCTSQYAGDTCTLVIETTSMEIPTYFSDDYITKETITPETNTFSYTSKDTTTISEADKCLPNSCITTIINEEPEHVQNSTERTINTKQFTEIKEIFTIPIENRTEYDQTTYTMIIQDYTTPSDEKTSLNPELQDLSSKAINETTFKVFTTELMSKMYPVHTTESNVFKGTTQASSFNESVMQFTIQDEITTMQSMTLKDTHQLSTIRMTKTSEPTTDISSEILNYSNTLEIESTTSKVELTSSAKTAESIITTSEQPTGAEYDETQNSTDFSVTERDKPIVTMTSLTTTFPSNNISEDYDNRVVTQLDVTTSNPTEKFSNSTITIEPKTIDSATSEDDFKTVTEFHRTTFGTDIVKNEVTNVFSTTEYKVIHGCTKDQCANTSLCLYNATQCDCSYWNNCKKFPNIEHAAFGGKSYIRQKFTIDNGILSIFVRLKTKAKSGILIHALFDDERYALLYLETGQLKFQFSCGLQTMLFGELDLPINNGQNVDIEMRFQYIVEEIYDKCSARLLVNGTATMSGEQILQTHESVPKFARLHLGGIPVAFSHQFPQIVLGFIGCMSSLKVNDIKRDFIHDSSETVQIEECNSFLCLSNPCKNFGSCEEINGKINCKCFAGYFGETCEKSICDNNPCHLGATCLISPGVNFICICPLGTHGLFCEKDTTVVQPSFSVFSPGFSSYMAYGVSSSLKDNMELKLRIIPQTLEQISLIAYMGQSGLKRETSDHFSITYVRGYLMLTWDLGSGVRRIFTSTPLNIRTNKVHTLHIGRRGRDSWLYVEGIGNITGRTSGTNTRLDVSPILYIGGHKSKYFEILPHDLPLHTGFIGCIYGIELRTDDNVFPVLISSPATGRGVGECHRNECSHHSCKNGAVCLNYGPTYSCICMKDWAGPDCSSSINCTASTPLCHKNRK